MQRKSDVSSANEIQRFESEKVHVDWIFWLVSLRFSSVSALLGPRSSLSGQSLMYGAYLSSIPYMWPLVLCRFQPSPRRSNLAAPGVSHVLLWHLGGGTWGLPQPVTHTTWCAGGVSAWSTCSRAVGSSVWICPAFYFLGRQFWRPWGIQPWWPVVWVHVLSFPAPFFPLTPAPRVILQDNPLAHNLGYKRASLIVQLVKNPPAMQETLVWFLGWEDPLEKG